MRRKERKCGSEQTRKGGSAFRMRKKNERVVQGREGRMKEKCGEEKGK